MLSKMRQFVVVAAIAALVLAMPAEARRGGGGFRSSGSRSRSTPRRSTTPKARKSYKAKPKAKETKSYKSTPKTAKSKNTGKSYSSSKGQKVASKTNTKPKTALQRKRVKAESVAKYRGSKYYKQAKPAAAPRKTYTTASGKTINIKNDSTQVKGLRSQLSQQRWGNRQLRQKNFYGNRYANRPLVIYNDPYSSNFFYHAMGSPWLHLWMYHHMNSISAERRERMYQENADLKARVVALETAKTPRNESYVPDGMKDNSDLMYQKSYVEAVYNPQIEVPIEQKQTAAGSMWKAIQFLFLLAIAIFIIVVGGRWLVRRIQGRA